LDISKDDVAEVIGAPQIENLDFSVWHPLDHRPWSARCRTFYGGGVHHVTLWREYQAPRPIQRIKCRLGWHDWSEYYARKERGGPIVLAGVMCRECWIRQP
jgi:hypothetical protein